MDVRWRHTDGPTRGEPARLDVPMIVPKSCKITSPCNACSAETKGDAKAFDDSALKETASVCEDDEIMKSQNIVANADRVLKGASQPGEAGQERSKNARLNSRSASEPSRSTSSVAEFTAWTWTTGCRRNASSRKNPKTTRKGQKRSDETERDFWQGMSISLNRRYPTCIKKHSHLTTPRWC